MFRRGVFVLIVIALVACNGIAPPANGDLPVGSDAEDETSARDASEDETSQDVAPAGDASADGSDDPTEAPSSDSSGDGAASDSGSADPTEEPTEAPTEAPPEEPAIVPGIGFTLEGVGFATPESVLHDPLADVYLVSNINGSPNAADGNGFISRVSPDGTLLDLKWIDGEADGVTLDAPKGMALTADYLWVSDVTAVRIFDRTTGAPTGEVSVVGASFLNDAAAAPDGSVWVTDSGTGAVYRIGEDRTAVLVTTVPGANGIAFFNATPLVTSGMSILQIAEDGTTSEVEPVPTGSLDGLIVLSDGSLAVSSWGGSAVYLIHSAGTDTLIDGVPGPADIGVDEGRSLILIPHFQNDRVQAVPLP